MSRHAIKTLPTRDLAIATRSAHAEHVRYRNERVGFDQRPRPGEKNKAKIRGLTLRNVVTRAATPLQSTRGTLPSNRTESFGVRECGD